MIDKNFKKEIGEFEKIGLMPDEKQAVLERISNYADSNPVKADAPRVIPSPFFGWTFVLAHQKMRLVYAAAAIVLIITSSVGTVFAAEQSLPGDILYPIKIRVTEPAQGLLKVGDEAKAKWEGERAVKRLKEAERLIEMGRLDDNKRERIEREFEKNTNSFIEKVEKVEEGERQNDSNDINTDDDDVKDDNQDEQIDQPKDRDSTRDNFELNVERQLMEINERIDERKDDLSDDQEDEVDNLQRKIKEKIDLSRERREGRR